MKIINADISTGDSYTEVTVDALAPTLGWQDVGLSAVVYIAPPQDGIQDIILHGKPPAGPALQALQLFYLTERLGIPEWLRGVRIVDAQNGNPLTLYKLVQEVAPIGKDHTFLKAGGLKGDKLLLDVAYGGGCAPHDFQLSWDGAVIKTQPPQVRLELSHDAHGDPCKAFIQKTLQFDLSDSLPDAGQYIIIVTSGDSEIIANNPAP